MNFGIIATIIIFIYLARRFPWLETVVGLLSIVCLGWVLTIFWWIFYPDDLRHFWMLLGAGIGLKVFIWLIVKAVDDLIGW